MSRKAATPQQDSNGTWSFICDVGEGTDGKRRITSVSEITGMESSVITQQDIFKFEQRGTDKDGKIVGEYRPTGVRPKIMERIEKFGINPADVVRPLLQPG